MLEYLGNNFLNLFQVLEFLGGSNNQGGQNFFEPIRTKIRTFSDEIRKIRTIFEKQSVQFFFLKISTIRTFF